MLLNFDKRSFEKSACLWQCQTEYVKWQPLVIERVFNGSMISR